ncbi:MAG: hypothetical protein ABJN69_04050 [Hellea sp.]
MTDTINYQAPKPQFDVGRVINRTFGAIKNNFVSFFLASLIIMGVPTFFIGLMPVFFSTGGMFDGDTVNQGFFASFIAMAVISFIVVMIGSVILQGALIYGAIADFNGRKAPFKECMSVALRYFFPLLILGILVGLGMVFGFILVIVPGVFIALGWSIAAPVLIVEGKGITDSISRSWDLTKGYKRWILLLFIILMVLSSIIGGVLGAFTFVAGDPTEVLLGGGSPTFHILNSFFSALSQTFTTMISATGAAAIYYEIRQIKEGIGAESLADIFD